MNFDSSSLPSYDELPVAPQGGRSAWGIFGPDDQMGLFNLLTPDNAAAAAKLIRGGASSRSMPPSTRSRPSPPPGHPPARGAPCRHRSGSTTSTTISIRRVEPVGFPRARRLLPDAFYNGATEEDVRAGRRNTIEHWARKGIWRAEVVDMVRTGAEAAGRTTRHETAFSVADLEAGGPGLASRYARVTCCWCTPASPAGTSNSRGRGLGLADIGTPGLASAKKCVVTCGTPTSPPWSPTPMR